MQKCTKRDQFLKTILSWLSKKAYLLRVVKMHSSGDKMGFKFSRGHPLVVYSGAGGRGLESNGRRSNNKR